MSKTYIPVALRRLVIERADNCCEYCLVPEWMSLARPYHIDHIVSEKQLGSTTEANLALSCRTCNLTKGDSIVARLEGSEEYVTLYHPRRDVWTDHFALSPDGYLGALTQRGAGTIRLLRLNRLNLVQIRKLLVEDDILQVPAP